MSSTGSLDRALVSEIAHTCREATSVLFITGAGISAESGLPTYRGVGGLYSDGKTAEGPPIEELLSGEMLHRNPALCWKYISQIETACRGARPGRAHEIVAAFEKKIPRTWVLTQNVDGFHGRAGSSQVMEIHGNLGRLACTECSYRTRVESYAGMAIPPSCPRCGSVLRPEVVLFGEVLPRSATLVLEHEMAHGFDMVFSIGTTSAFPYIQAPITMARRHGAVTVEINPEETEMSESVHHSLRARAGDALSAIWAGM